MLRVLNTFAHTLLVLSLALLPLRAAFAMPFPGDHCDMQPASPAMDHASHVPMDHAHHHPAPLSEADAASERILSGSTQANCECCDDCTVACAGCAHTATAIPGLHTCPLAACTDEKVHAGALRYPNSEPSPLLRPPRS